MGRGRLSAMARGATVPATASLILLVLALVTGPIAAQAPRETVRFTSDALFFENGDYRFSVAFPKGCRHEEGPGTLDAICSSDLDPEKGATVEKTGALVLSFAYELIDTTSASNAERLTESAFREDLPESVCGESDKTRARIENLKRREEFGVVNQAADVVCAEVKFLQIGPRRASVVQLIAPRGVFRLMVRAPKEDFEKQTAAIDEFFTSFSQSFNVLQAEKRQAEKEGGKQ
jgi:hypothetical protein